MPNFKPGDFVVEFNKEQVMKVVRLTSEGEWLCTWTGSGGELTEAPFPVTVLRSAPQMRAPR
jgi:hypothetical protein